MRLVNCLCGKRIEAADEAGMAAAFWTHTDSEHADIKISDARRKELDEALRRSGGWDGERERIESAIDVRPLTPAMREQYLAYFDGPAFCDNPVWSRCYCLSYHVDLPPGGDFDERSGVLNRAERAAQIDRGQASGVIAFGRDARGGEQVVGWCNASPRTTLPLLDRTPGFECDDRDNTASIVCYVIAPRYRGQGIARKLLEGAETMTRARGMRWLEAFPPKDARTDAGSYHGRLSMYLDAGFEQVREAGRYVVVRKALG